MTVCGLGNRKDLLFQAAIKTQGVNVYPGTIAFVRALHRASVRVAVTSASRSAALVLRAAGVLDLFDAKVDGLDAERLGLPGKPDPALFLTAARLLDATPDRALVVEDAIPGIEAARRGRFALAIGVDRSGHRQDLLAAGASVVVPDLADVDVVVEAK